MHNFLDKLYNRQASVRLYNEDAIEDVSKMNTAELRKAKAYIQAKQRQLKGELEYVSLSKKKYPKSYTLMKRNLDMMSRNYKLYLDRIERVIKSRKSSMVKKRAKSRRATASEIEAKLSTKAQKRYDQLKKIVKESQRGKVEGVNVDTFSAATVLKVIDQVKHENKEKLLGLAVDKMISVCFKVLSK